MVTCEQIQSHLSAFLLCDYKKLSKVHLNFPIEREYTDHNEGKNMLITTCLILTGKKNVPIYKMFHFEVLGTMWWWWVECPRWVLLVFLPSYYLFILFYLKVPVTPSLPYLLPKPPTLLLCIKVWPENTFQTMSYSIYLETKEMVA